MRRKSNNRRFSFEISLSVLNHLGRNLYRSFSTVLGEAISNSWDADAEKVHIYIDRRKNSFFIKDDGLGMTANDFQNKFLKIGYSKRKEGTESAKKRPYIGRKGIGKLALLSCADRITVISKVRGGDYIGGVIDNSGLDEAITEDLTPAQYQLGPWDLKTFKNYTKGHVKGTIIHFENIHEGIKNSIDFLEKIVALYFRFSLLDNGFRIFINNKEITQDSLDELASNTEYLWRINDLDDPYIKKLEKNFQSDYNEQRQIRIAENLKGFIASVEKPRHLRIITTDEKVSVDLFVNGRLRERDILKHIPTARVVESYLYGQIHFDILDDAVDRFTSSRESIVADDPKYKSLLDAIREKIISKILSDWDKWRVNHHKDGDPENKRISKRDRKAGELFNAVSEEYILRDDSAKRKEVNDWVDSLGEDATFNFSSYAECFISENLIRKFIHAKKVSLSPGANKQIEYWQGKERENKNKGNISIRIRKTNSKLSYLSMDDLANLVDKSRDQLKEACLARDANEYRPIRDALAHTALLTDEAKSKLTTVYANIKERIRILLTDKKGKP